MLGQTNSTGNRRHMASLPSRHWMWHPISIWQGWDETVLWCQVTRLWLSGSRHITDAILDEGISHVLPPSTIKLLGPTSHGQVSVGKGNTCFTLQVINLGTLSIHVMQGLSWRPCAPSGVKRYSEWVNPEYYTQPFFNYLVCCCLFSLDGIAYTRRPFNCIGDAEASSCGQSRRTKFAIEEEVSGLQFLGSKTIRWKFSQPRFRPLWLLLAPDRQNKRTIYFSTSTCHT